MGRQAGAGNVHPAAKLNPVDSWQAGAAGRVGGRHLSRPPPHSLTNFTVVTWCMRSSSTCQLKEVGGRGEVSCCACGEAGGAWGLLSTRMVQTAIPTFSCNNNLQLAVQPSRVPSPQGMGRGGTSTRPLGAHLLLLLLHGILDVRHRARRLLCQPHRGVLAAAAVVADLQHGNTHASTPHRSVARCRAAGFSMAWQPADPLRSSQAWQPAKHLSSALATG